MQNIITGAWLLVAALVAGCQTMDVESDHDPAVDFSRYRSFGWVSPHPLLASAPGVSPLAEERIQRSVSQVLASRGYRLVGEPAAADFLIGFTVGAREKVTVTSSAYPVGFHHPYAWGGAYYSDVEVRQHTEGQLAIDIFDTRLRRPVWHGYATKNMTGSDRSNSEAVISKAVTAILAEFPPDDR